MPASFDNDILTVQNELITLINGFTDPNGGTVTASRTFSRDGILDSELPYVWVKRGRQLDRAEISADLYKDTYPFQALVYVDNLADGELDDEIEFDNASNWSKPFHKYLADNRDFYEATTIVIASVRDTSDVNMFGKDGTRYSGIAFTIPIQILTRF